MFSTYSKKGGSQTTLDTFKNFLKSVRETYSTIRND